jgi:hypothetical protein
MEVDLNFFLIEDTLNSFASRRRPQYFDKWKTASIFWKMEDDFKIQQMKDEFKILQMEDHFKI